MLKELNVFEAEEVMGGDWFSDAGKAITGAAKAVANTASSVIQAVGHAVNEIGAGINNAIGSRDRTYYPNGQVKSSSCKGITCLTNK